MKGSERMDQVGKFWLNRRSMIRSRRGKDPRLNLWIGEGQKPLELIQRKPIHAPQVRFRIPAHQKVHFLCTAMVCPV